MAENEAKKAYEPPRLEKFGSVGRLTLSGLGNTNPDFEGGSVNPPGGGPPNG